jgi:5-hydroxyisourate hydrolase-like protein (transthyretin family)
VLVFRLAGSIEAMLGNVHALEGESGTPAAKPSIRREHLTERPREHLTSASTVERDLQERRLAQRFPAVI